jgi:hypothetical protein
MEDICGQQGCHYQTIHFFFKLETCAVSVQSCQFNIIMNCLANLSSSALWWKGQQWQLQEPSTWPNLEISTSTDNLEA